MIGNLDANPDEGWQVVRNQARDAIFNRLASIGIDTVREHISFEVCFTPCSWRKRYNLFKGATHGLSHSLTQLAYLRPHNRHAHYHNRYFAGASTHPGTGMPTVLVSARHYLREIEALTQQPVRAVQRELARLESAGILQSQREGNRKYFQANRDSPVFSELRSLLIKTAGFSDVIRNKLQEESESIQIAFLFGSYARGAESITSDIDLMIIGRISSRELSHLLKPAKVTLGREINPIIIHADEFQDKVIKEDLFIQNLLQEPKTFLVGDESELRELASRRTS